MEHYIPRSISSQIMEAHGYFPVIVISGPRQSGKSTLCRNLFPDYRYVNLEDITMRAIAISDPTAFLESLGMSAIIDEVQYAPELLSMIQLKVDENSSRHYILTGSSNFSLLSSVSQSLAGRAALFTLLPFSLTEVKTQISEKNISSIQVDGLYPGVIAKGIPSNLFYRNYYNTYIERDLRDLLRVKNILAFDTFMRLLASRIGSEFNASAIAREVGVSSVTISEWLSILAASYIAFPLRPYFNNIGKRLTKMPKIYFYDTGIACFLLGIENDHQLQTHPLRGALFENIAICELIKREFNAGKDCNIYFFREKSGLESDVLLLQPGGISLFEIKSGETYRPSFSQNMKEISDSLPSVLSTSVIYNGPSIPPVAINIRDI